MEERRELPEQGDVQRVEADEHGQLGLFAVARRRHSGPLPDPATLAAYNAIDPTFAERIVRMAENDQQSIQGAIDRTSRAEAYAVKVGMTAMVIISLLSLGLAAWLIAVGQPAGAYLLAVPLMTAAPQFIAALKGREPKNAPGADGPDD